jgi:hypothetical protein
MHDSCQIGRIFTPLAWAIWLIEQSGAFEAWLQGACVLDPTCGHGSFLEAFLSLARQRGQRIRPADVPRLYGIEMVGADKAVFLARIWRNYGVHFPEENFTLSDFIVGPSRRRFDLLVGNPPWANFADLPAELKQRWSAHFIRHGLVKSRRDVLLGKSRADVASLVVKKAIDEALCDGGRAAFFVPMSMFFNSGANDRFRPYPGSDHSYRVLRLWDFGSERIFEGVATRYGAALFEKRSPQAWPVETFAYADHQWRRAFSTASDRQSGCWQRHGKPFPAGWGDRSPRIEIHAAQKPRQGINTCGANEVFIFTRESDGRFRNGRGEIVELESELMHPLMHVELFKWNDSRLAESKWILVPHDTGDGRPLDAAALASFPRSRAWLAANRHKLTSRKGTMIRERIARGLWWSLLGVGPYSFSPWKVAWGALGKRRFRPVVLEGRWQGNQALHAFCPCASKADAMNLCASLRTEAVARWLESSAMAGTCNWAQPGRISQLLTFR